MISVTLESFITWLGFFNMGNKVSRQTTSIKRSQNINAQNVFVFWVDSNIDPANTDFNNSLTLLRSVVCEVKICLEPVECFDALNELEKGRAFVISSGALGEYLVPLIHDIQRLHAIYIFCRSKIRHELWVKDWSKVQGVFTSIEPICDSLKNIVHQSDHNDIPMSFVSKQSITAASNNDGHNLNSLPPSYMYSTIFKDIILEIPDDYDRQMQDFVNYCRNQEVLESQLTSFQNDYHDKSPVWWYTRSIFLYGMLNKVLRSLDMEGMVKIGFFVRHLHQQLAHLHQEQSAKFTNKFIVYRGQTLCSEDFQGLYDSEGGLLSFNNFLSTSKKEEVAMRFVRRTMNRSKDDIGIIFVMTIDPNKISTSTTPYALIDDHSAFPSEQEILFTMHTVFRVVDIKQRTQNNELWDVHLTITDDNDLEMVTLTNRLKEEINGIGWYRMGELMLRVGHFNQAEELYNELLSKATSDSTRQHIYHQLGRVKWQQGKHAEEITFYEKSLQLKLKTVSKYDISLAHTYNNIAHAYNSMGDYSEALKFHKKSRKIKKKALVSKHPDVATSYNNIGLVYNNMRKYSKALKFHQKSLKLREEVLPSNHSDLATSYNNVGLAYNNMGHYSKALEFYEKSLKIRKQTLPAGHPDFAYAYNNIGSAYSGMGENSKALQYLEESLAICHKSLPPTHFLTRTVLHSIASVKTKM